MAICQSSGVDESTYFTNPSLIQYFCTNCMAVHFLFVHHTEANNTHCCLVKKYGTGNRAGTTVIMIIMFTPTSTVLVV